MFVQKEKIKMNGIDIFNMAIQTIAIICLAIALPYVAHGLANHELPDYKEKK